MNRASNLAEEVFKFFFFFGKSIKSIQVKRVSTSEATIQGFLLNQASKHALLNNDQQS